MTRLITSALCLAALGAAIASAAQTTSTALCDGIAAQIRGDREIASGSKDDPLAVLSKGDHAYIELPVQSDMRVIGDATEFTNSFRAKFNPSDELAKAVAKFFDGDHNGEVYSLPDSDLHMVEESGGTANCEGFLFFETARGRQSQLLPDLPKKGDSDGVNVICSGFGDDGHLAKVAGDAVFLESMNSDNHHELRVVPWQRDHWEEACRVEADFRSAYDVTKVYVPKDGPVTEAPLRDVAAQVVELHDAAKNPKAFTFGPAVPADERGNFRTMIGLAAKVRNWPVPAFGAEKELTAFQESLQSADNYPLVLGGQAYLMRVGHGSIGWRISSDSIVILYTLKDGKLEPVATAIVQQSQGALEFARAIESR